MQNTKVKGYTETWNVSQGDCASLLLRDTK